MRMRRVQGEAARREGIQMAKELIEAAIPYFNGIYLITPFHYYPMSVELIQYVRQQTGLQQAAGRA